MRPCSQKFKAEGIAYIMELLDKKLKRTREPREHLQALEKALRKKT